MHMYFAQLLSTTLAVPVPIVIALWALSFTISQLSYRARLKRSQAQQIYTVSGSTAALQGALSAASIMGQVLFAGTIFAISAWAGGSYFAFLGGGYMIATSVIAANNLRGLLFEIALTKPGAVSGSIAFSSEFSIRTQCYLLFSEALIFLIAGLAALHLALFGAAYFLMALGFGYLRRIRHTRADKKTYS